LRAACDLLTPAAVRWRVDHDGLTLQQDHAISFDHCIQCERGAPVSRWHQLQWQQWTISGFSSSRYRTLPQVQPPSMTLS
jgi:hypothetical protein